MQPAVIVEGHPVHHRLPGLLSDRKFPAMRTDRFQPAPETLLRRIVPAVALPVQPFPFIDECMP